MMDHAFLGYYSGMLLSDNGYRCMRCGHGPVVGSDGFMAACCLNCGNYRSGFEPIDLGLGELFKKLVAWARRGVKRLRGVDAETAPSSEGAQ